MMALTLFLAQLVLRAGSDLVQLSVDGEVLELDRARALRPQVDAVLRAHQRFAGAGCAEGDAACVVEAVASAPPSPDAAAAVSRAFHRAEPWPAVAVSRVVQYGAERTGTTIQFQALAVVLAMLHEDRLDELDLPSYERSPACWDRPEELARRAGADFVQLSLASGDTFELDRARPLRPQVDAIMRAKPRYGGAGCAAGDVACVVEAIARAPPAPAPADDCFVAPRTLVATHELAEVDAFDAATRADRAGPAWLFATVDGDARAAAELEARLAARGWNATILVLVAPRAALDARGADAVVEAYAPVFGLSVAQADALRAYMALWMVLRRCCGAQMSQHWRRALHEGGPARGGAAECAALDLGAVEARLLATEVYRKYRRVAAIRTVSDVDGDLDGSYCLRCAEQVQRHRLGFNDKCDPPRINLWSATRSVPVNVSGRGVLTLPFPATASRSTLHAVARDFALRHGLTSSPPVESIVESMAAAQLHWPSADLLAERALARRRWRVAHSDVSDDRLL